MQSQRQLISMVQQVTQGIKVSVETLFEGTFYKDYKMCYAFAYTITIENQGNDAVQLVSRHWEIKDALNDLEVVDGEGVIGKKPILRSGEKHTYSSGCLLQSPFGAMQGYFSMINFATTRKFRVKIPSFKLSAPLAIN